MKLKPYNKKSAYSLVLGVNNVIEVLKVNPKIVAETILSKKLEKSLVDKIIALCRKNNIEFRFDSKSIERFAYKENTYAIAIIRKFESSIKRDKTHLMLYQINNMGNLGTIIRSTHAFNVLNLALIKPSCDIFDPKVISSSMGSFFSINFEYFTSIEEYKNKYPNNLYLFTLDGQKELKNTKFDKPFTLVFGSENHGLPKSCYFLGQTVKIEHSKGVDSLNIAISASIALYNLKIH